jgi:hypothetical protein
VGSIGIGSLGYAMGADPLLAWLRDRGVQWDDDATRVERCTRTGDRSIRCVRPIRRGMLLARIPKDRACLTRLTASATTRALLERAEHARAAAPDALRYLMLNHTRVWVPNPKP